MKFIVGKNETYCIMLSGGNKHILKEGTSFVIDNCWVYVYHTRDGEEVFHVAYPREVIIGIVRGDD